MWRACSATVLLAAIMTAGSGCTNFATSRVVNDYQENLVARDLAELRSRSSAEFADRALRLPEAADDLKILRLPKGKAKVVEVEKLSSEERLVHVEIGDRKVPLDIELVKNPAGRGWLVDDIIDTQQRSRDAEGVSRSVSEQMDLLLSVREIMNAWESGERDAILAIATDEFGDALGDLPDAWLDQLARQIGETGRNRSFRPEARMADQRAIVVIPRSGGKLLLELSNVEGKWQINDAAIESPREKEALTSARKLSRLLTQCAVFLEGYEAQDRKQLGSVTSSQLYENVLGVADLSTVPIPTQALLQGSYEYRPHSNRADVLLSHAEDTYLLSLVAPLAEDDTTVERDATFHVDGVTIYEEGGEHVKSLASVFMAEAIVDVYAAALAERDRSRLEYLSSTDFSEKVWRRAGDNILKFLPMDEIEQVKPEIVSTSYAEPVTEVTVKQGTRLLTYVLRSNRGRVVVDDVLLPVIGRPNSLKKNLTVMIPVYEFAYGIYNNDLETLRKTSSDGMRRMIWSQVSSVPEIGWPVVRQLTAPIQKLQVQNDQAFVELSDGQYLARVRLQRVGETFVVADATLASSNGLHQVELLQAMR
ncbi:MAG: hypothetical protein ACF8TS_13080, partial [Maioricimonas sp. JB049]